MVKQRHIVENNMSSVVVMSKCLFGLPHVAIESRHVFHAAIEQHLFIKNYLDV